MTKRNVISLLVVFGVLIVVLIVTMIAPSQESDTKDQLSTTTVEISTTTSTTTVEKNNTQNDTTEVIVPAPEALQPLHVTIMYPENMDKYIGAINQYISSGGINPATNWKFVPKDVTVNFIDDVIRSSAQAAAEQIDASGGPGKVQVVYLKIVGDTAYVVLNIDLDGYAGVSFAIAKIHPMVEKTLLQFSQIKQVKFNLAPEDVVKNNIQKGF